MNCPRDLLRIVIGREHGKQVLTAYVLSGSYITLFFTFAQMNERLASSNEVIHGASFF